MHIVHAILTDSFAGSERYAVELANAQAGDHQVTMVLHRDAGQARPDALAHRLSPQVRPVFVSGFPWLAALRARRVIDALAPDVAHAHLSWACKSLAGVRRARARIATLHIRYKPQQHARLDGLIAIAPWQLAEVPAGCGLAEAEAFCRQVARQHGAQCFHMAGAVGGGREEFQHLRPGVQGVEGLAGGGEAGRHLQAAAWRVRSSPCSQPMASWNSMRLWWRRMRQRIRGSSGC